MLSNPCQADKGSLQQSFFNHYLRYYLIYYVWYCTVLYQPT